MVRQRTGESRLLARPGGRAGKNCICSNIPNMASSFHRGIPALNYKCYFFMLIPCSEGCGLAFCCFCLFRFCLLSWWFFNRKKKNPNVFKTASDSPFPGALVFCMAFYSSEQPAQCFWCAAGRSCIPAGLPGGRELLSPGCFHRAPSRWHCIVPVHLGTPRVP